jgi:hypothetical protein
MPAPAWAELAVVLRNFPYLLAQPKAPADRYYRKLPRTKRSKVTPQRPLRRRTPNSQATDRKSSSWRLRTIVESYSPDADAQPAGHSKRSNSRVRFGRPTGQLLGETSPIMVSSTGGRDRVATVSSAGITIGASVTCKRGSLHVEGWAQFFRVGGSAYRALGWNLTLLREDFSEFFSAVSTSEFKYGHDIPLFRLLLGSIDAVSV